MSQQLEAALKYLARGWAVLPMSRKSKRPIVKWKEFQSRLPTEAEVRQWWSEYPRANVGIITGAVSGIVVLDEDGEEWDAEAGTKSIAEQGGIPSTLRSQTRKGFHHVYNHPGEEVRNFVRDFPGLDFRGDGGYIVAPPSLHETRHVYEWVDEAEPIAEMPAWLLEWHRSKRVYAPTEPVESRPLQIGTDGNPAYVQAAVTRELDVLRSTPIGQQNEQLNKSAFKLGTLVGAGAVSRSEAESQIEAVVLSWPCGTGRPPWTRENMRDTLNSGLDAGQARPRQIPESTFQKTPMLRGRAVRAFIAKKSQDEIQGEAEREDFEEGEIGDSSTAGAYRLHQGRTFLLIEKKQTGKDNNTSENTHTGVVWDGAAHIAEEITNEDGTTIYKIEGRTKRGRCFSLELPAAKFAEPRQVFAALKDNAGAGCVFAAGMEKHLGPSIDSFTSHDTLQYGRRFKRVGWHKTPQGWEFLVPGREAEHTTIELNRKLPYGISPIADLDKGLEVLADLFNAQQVEATTVATMPAFQAPLARLANWVDERSVMFIDGRTGSFKSSWAMVMMSLWGAGFSNEDNVLKMGEGGTNVARMRMAVFANDVPLLFDNYKPNTGKGAPELVAMIHQIIEGGEKDRGNVDGGLRDSNVVHCWPVFTGEDFPDSEASTAARCLIVNFPFMGLDENPILHRVQSSCFHLSAVMGAWLDWLSDEANEPDIKRVASQFNEHRTAWARRLRLLRPDMANISRVASNLATNELTWRAMSLCPLLDPVCRQFAEAHHRGLELVAESMARRTAESSEANRFLSALKALISSNQAALKPSDEDFPEETKGIKYLGWQDAKGVYLILDVALDNAQKLLRESGGLNGLSKHALTRQLEQIGKIAQKGTDGATRAVRLGSGSGTSRKAVRVLHLTPDCLDERDEDEPKIDGDAEVI